LHAAECEQLTRKGCGAVGGAFDLLNLAARLSSGASEPSSNSVWPLITINKLLKSVRDASGQSADCFHFLRLPQLFFELLPLAISCATTRRTRRPAYSSSCATSSTLKTRPSLLAWRHCPR